MASPSKSCGSDPIPTTLLKEILSSVIDFITAIVNQSLQEGDMPDNTKESLINPVLKKANLELLDKNFMPVSNPSFFSKLTERCAASNIVTYAEENNLMEPNQSAYHQHFSTKANISATCMCRHYQGHVKQEISCLILWDLWAVFDTTDHEILLTRHVMRLGIRGMVNKWIES